MTEIEMKRTRDLLARLIKFLPERKFSERCAVLFSLVILFIISFAYFYWFGNSIFFYQENKSLFIFSEEYFQEFAIKPGGLLVYAGNFLTQGYFSSFYGSLVISLLFIILCVVYLRIIKRLSPSGSFSLFFIILPSGLLLLLQTRYDLYIQHILGFLLVSFWFWISIIQVRKCFPFIILLFFPLVFYLTGSFAWIYLGSYLIYCVINEKEIPGYILTSFLSAIALLTFIIFKEVLFLQPFDHLLRYPLFFNETSRLTELLYMFTGFVILIPLFLKISGKIAVNEKFAGVIHLTTIMILFPVIIFILFKNYDPVYANVLQIEKSFYKHDWDAVIKTYERSPSKNIIGQYYYNLALSEKNQLCSRMFYGQQNFGPLSLTLPREGDQAFRAVYFYYAIGLISEAHHLAYELMVLHGFTPENIKMLIKTELINGNFRIAERYLNVLKKTLHYRVWAMKYEKMNYNPAMINSDPELGDKMRLLPKGDFFIVPDDVKSVELYLNENPDNKRAIEYKLARLMLEKDMLAVAEEVKKLKARGYTYLPRHIEEVIVALKSLSKDTIDLGGLSVNPETERRFLQYRAVYNASRGNKSLIERNAKKAEKNTFWYYLQFGTVSSDYLERKLENNNVY